jgi:hypothetical protein
MAVSGSPSAPHPLADQQCRFKLNNVFSSQDFSEILAEAGPLNRVMSFERSCS